LLSILNYVICTNQNIDNVRILWHFRVYNS